MKKKAIIVLLVWCLFVAIVWPYRVKSYADPFTAAQIGSAAAAVFNSWGMSFTMGTGATQESASGFFAAQVEDYVNSKGGTVADVFVGQIAVDAAGKLVVGQSIYNELKNFADWLIPKYNLSENNALLGQMFDDNFIDANNAQAVTDVLGFSWVWDEPTSSVWLGHWTGPGYVGPQYGDVTTYLNEKGETYYFWVGEQLKTTTSFSRGSQSRSYTSPYITAKFMADQNNMSYASMSGNIADFVEPTVLNPDKEWTGTIGGYSTPDTNLDQLMGGIDQAVSDNNLVVDGEVIDVPVPPTPAPTMAPGIPDIIGGLDDLNGGVDNIDTNLGDVLDQLESQQEALEGIEGAIEGVQEGIQTQTGVISGAMEQAAQDVVDAIGEQTAALDETLTETAEGVQEIAEALQPGEIEPKKFDLRRLFPFCIPFDIHNMLQKFNAEPVAPHVQLPFVIQSLGFSYTFDLDFSAFDPVAQAMRTVEFIVFAIGLAWATSKVIKW